MDFEITEAPKTGDIDFLTQKIHEETKDQGSVDSFAIYHRNRDGKITAGCNGFIIYGSIYTDQLWVDPTLRKEGIGKSLMEKVHEYGRQKGCTQATVSTMSFQVPDFYKSLGYKVDYIRKGYANEAKCIFYSKVF